MVIANEPMTVEHIIGYMEEKGKRFIYEAQASGDDDLLKKGEWYVYVAECLRVRCP